MNAAADTHQGLAVFVKLPHRGELGIVHLVQRTLCLLQAGREGVQNSLQLAAAPCVNSATRNCPWIRHREIARCGSDVQCQLNPGKKDFRVGFQESLSSGSLQTPLRRLAFLVKLHQNWIHKSHTSPFRACRICVSHFYPLIVEPSPFRTEETLPVVQGSPSSLERAYPALPRWAVARGVRMTSVGISHVVKFDVTSVSSGPAPLANSQVNTIFSGGWISCTCRRPRLNISALVMHFQAIFCPRRAIEFGNHDIIIGGRSEHSAPARRRRSMRGKPSAAGRQSSFI